MGGGQKKLKNPSKTGPGKLFRPRDPEIRDQRLESFTGDPARAREAVIGGFFVFMISPPFVESWVPMHAIKGVERRSPKLFVLLFFRFSLKCLF